MTHHEMFGKVLASLQLSTFLRGADYGNVTNVLIVMKKIIHTIH